MSGAGSVILKKGFPVRYEYWPAYSLRMSMLLMDAFDNFPGQRPWVCRTRRKLDSALHTGITILNELAFLQRLLHEQLKRELTGLSVPEFVEWTSSLDLAATPELIPTENDIEALKDGRARLGTGDRYAEWNGIPLESYVVDRIRRFINGPEELKRFTVHVCHEFWNRHLEAEFTRLAPQIRAIVERGNRNTAPRTCRELILELVGREPAARSLDENEFDLALAIPVCHLGAMVSTFYMRDGSYALAAFESSRTPPVASLSAAEITPFTYRALADETRLNMVRMLAGGEMYGMEIADACALGQPTVSKHLRILVSEGILTVRREGSTKYYSVNEARLGQIGRSIMDLGGT